MPRFRESSFRGTRDRGAGADAMPRRCTVCGDERRLRIEQAVIAGGSIRGIARRFGISDDALSRHAKAHLPAKLKTAAQAEEVLTADRLLAEVQGFARDAKRLQARAEKGNDVRTAIQALRERTRNVELLVRAYASRPPAPKEAVKFTVDLSVDEDAPARPEADTAQAPAPARLLAAPNPDVDDDGAALI